MTLYEQLDSIIQKSIEYGPDSEVCKQESVDRARIILNKLLTGGVIPDYIGVDVDGGVGTMFTSKSNKRGFISVFNEGEDYLSLYKTDFSFIESKPYIDDLIPSIKLFLTTP